MHVPFYQVDAFAERPLEGNPAAVLVLEDSFPSNELLQSVARENNLSETAFLVPVAATQWKLRWFTPMREVPLCGHATLAAAHVVYSHLGSDADELSFATLSGSLPVRRSDDRLTMDLPSDPSTETEAPTGLSAALGVEPREVWKGRYLTVVLDSASTVRALEPDIESLGRLDGGAEIGGAVCCAAPGDNGFDVVSRFFAPGAGVPEDPVTGSAHCAIAPLFRHLGPSLRCFQAFPGRGGIVRTELHGDRVHLSGHARTVIEGQFRLP